MRSLWEETIMQISEEAVNLTQSTAVHKYFFWQSDSTKHNFGFSDQARQLKSKFLARATFFFFFFHGIHTNSGGPPSLFSNRQYVLFLQVQSSWGMQLAMHLHLMLISRKHGAITSLPHVFMVWCSHKGQPYL